MSDQESSEMDPTECIAFLELLSDTSFGLLDIPLYPGREIVIGRDDKCNHVIVDDRVSKKHFRLYSIIYENKKNPAFPPLVYCEDLESFNGTYINDTLIGKISHEKVGHLLCDGDVLEIRPSWKFQFHQTSHPFVARDRTQRKDLKHFSDRFEVTDRKLGCGNYGDVFLATQTATSKQVACKIVDLKLAMQRLSESQPTTTSAGERWESGVQFAIEEKRRVLREIRILSSLSHPNVVDLKKAFCSHDSLYIFTELASGGDLYSYMQSHGGYLDDYNSRVITRQVALAVQFIHSKGIVHRDIKAENVLVTGTHFGGRVILTDFGFAVNVNPTTRRMLSKLGTPGYVAPEVEAVDESDSGYTIAADLWSLGVLTACMFTGDTTIPRQEITGLTHAELTSRYLGVDDRFAKVKWRTIPPRALKFIRRLIIINPEDRMTADEALEDSWYTKPPTEARALNEAIERINRFWRKRSSDEEVLEGLPGVILSTTMTSDPPTVKFRRRLPDASLSPYFGLDRHLHQRQPSTRKRLLEDLTQLGSQFVTTQNQRSPLPITARKSRASEIDVVGSDIFELAVTESAPEITSDLEEVDLVSTMAMSQVGDNGELDADGSLDPSTFPSIDIDTTDSPDVLSAKRARLDSEDRRVHDKAATTLPRYTTAKALKEAVIRMKGIAIHGGRVKPVSAS